MPAISSKVDFERLAHDIKRWGMMLGFQRVGIADTDLAEHEAHLINWLSRERHGEMSYMARHGARRSRPNDLVPGTTRIISVRLNYRPPGGAQPTDVLAASNVAYISRYALGRDYHKLMRKRLQSLAERIEGRTGRFGYRAFVDSAPVLEKAVAAKAGLGWIGKHTNLLSRDAGSWFFLGELYTDLPLPVDAAVTTHCGSCNACIDACPTGAIVAPYQLDARLCISYLTIELRGSIPQEVRPLIGNRIFGCDDCQLACPWNRFAQTSELADFAVRHGLDASRLVDLFRWSEQDFLRYTEGSTIRRIGYDCWLRNIAVALGNAPPSPAIRDALLARASYPSELVREHVRWALDQHRAREG
jgi:epoxyqueuosine reductase